jgi:thiol-disulfide isomerase/thioredoxin
MNRSPSWLAILLLSLGLFPGQMRAAGTNAAAPSFDLPQRGGSQRLQLANLTGRIVILDFFAHWCVPCVQASMELESGIGQYYQQRKGNAHGIPVELLPINIEGSRPDKTEAFIRRTGLKLVLDDLQGEVFRKYGGSGMPFLVIIDATGGKSGNLPARIVYRKAGFEGLPKLRQVIDAIVAENTATQPPDRSVPIPAHTPETMTHAGGALVSTASLDFASMFASDILLTDEHLEFRQTRPALEITLSLSHSHIGLHYTPDSALEQPKDVANDRYGFQTQGRLRVGDQLTLLLGGGAYSGYMDYRSLWLNEHFRQLFSPRQGYETAHPWGGNALAGLRWEYLPAAGFAQGDLGCQHDVISPSYDVSLAKFPPKLERFRADYDTLSGKVSLENVLTRRLRTLQELQIIDTTDRQLRLSLQSSLNCALAEHWVSKLVVSGTEESPRFQAGSAGATLERDWNESWFLGLTARGYSDNGEIENALLAENTADPPLKSFYAGLGLRWQGRQTSAKLSVGPYFAVYRQVGPAIDTFPHLFQNRDWFAVQFAFAREF